MSDRQCPLCKTNLRRKNQGPFCGSKECTKAFMALQAFVHGELGGRGMGHVRIDSISRDQEGVYTVSGSYVTRSNKEVGLSNVRFNSDGIAMGQRVTLKWGEG